MHQKYFNNEDKANEIVILQDQVNQLNRYADAIIQDIIGYTGGKPLAVTNSMLAMLGTEKVERQLRYSPHLQEWQHPRIGLSFLRIMCAARNLNWTGTREELQQILFNDLPHNHEMVCNKPAPSLTRAVEILHKSVTFKPINGVSILGYPIPSPNPGELHVRTHIFQLWEGAYQAAFPGLKFQHPIVGLQATIVLIKLVTPEAKAATTLMNFRQNANDRKLMGNQHEFQCPRYAQHVPLPPSRRGIQRSFPSGTPNIVYSNLRPHMEFPREVPSQPPTNMTLPKQMPMLQRAPQPRPAYNYSNAWPNHPTAAEIESGMSNMTTSTPEERYWRAWVMQNRPLPPIPTTTTPNNNNSAPQREQETAKPEVVKPPKLDFKLPTINMTQWRSLNNKVQKIFKNPPPPEYKAPPPYENPPPYTRTTSPMDEVEDPKAIIMKKAILKRHSEEQKKGQDEPMVTETTVDTSVEKPKEERQVLKRHNSAPAIGNKSKAQKPEPEPEVDKVYSPSTTPHESMETMPPSPVEPEAETMESRTTRTPMPSDDEEMEPNNDITEP